MPSDSSLRKIAHNSRRYKKKKSVTNITPKIQSLDILSITRASEPRPRSQNSSFSLLPHIYVYTGSRACGRLSFCFQNGHFPRAERAAAVFFSDVIRPWHRRSRVRYSLSLSPSHTHTFVQHESDSLFGGGVSPFTVRRVRARR